MHPDPFLSHDVVNPLVIAQEILVELFRNHEPVRSTILENIFNRIVTNHGNVASYIEVLGRMINGETQVSLSEYIPKVSIFTIPPLMNHNFFFQFKEIFEYLSLLPPETAAMLLESMAPLFKMSNSFQDYMMIVLRKAIYGK